MNILLLHCCSSAHFWLGVSTPGSQHTFRPGSRHPWTSLSIPTPPPQIPSFIHHCLWLKTNVSDCFVTPSVIETCPYLTSPHWVFSTVQNLKGQTPVPHRVSEAQSLLQQMHSMAQSPFLLPPNHFSVEVYYTANPEFMYNSGWLPRDLEEPWIDIDDYPWWCTSPCSLLNGTKDLLLMNWCPHGVQLKHFCEYSSCCSLTGWRRKLLNILQQSMAYRYMWFMPLCCITCGKLRVKLAVVLQIYRGKANKQARPKNTPQQMKKNKTQKKTHTKQQSMILPAISLRKHFISSWIWAAVLLHYELWV